MVLARLLAHLIREGEALYVRRLNECNGRVPEGYEKTTEKRMERLEAEAALFGLKLDWPDIRGPALRVLTPNSGKRNGWGDGWSLPSKRR